ncbi:MAG: SPFH domain-containing protein, partial [Mangrovicoccus sp.]
KLVGPKYPEILVYPEIGSHARDIIARYTPEQLYSDIRSFIQAQILERMVTELGASLVNQSVRGKLIEVEDVLIRSVVLPETVQKAIERKAEQYQAMLEYDFRLAREEKEKVRKSIEAEGIAAFQAKVADSITDEYLRLRGIEATVALAASRNSKMVIIGGKDGLPLILNTGETPLDATGGGGATGAGTNAGGLDNPVFSRTPQNARIDEFTPANSAMPDASTGFGSSGGATTTGQSQGGSTGTGRPSAPGSALAPSGDGGTAAREAPQAPNEMTGMAPSERSQSAGSGMNETPGNVQAQPSQPQTGAAQSGQSTPQDGQRASEINRGALNQDIPSTLNSFADRYRLGTN